jgi:hypothetical protein
MKAMTLLLLIRFLSQAPPGPIDMADCTDAFMTLAAVAACRHVPFPMRAPCSSHAAVSFAAAA